MSVVTIDRRQSVWEITLDRPRANAIDHATSRLLSEAFVGFRDDPAARVAILTAAGDKFFSAGWDLKAAAGGDSLDYGVGGFAGLTELFDLRKPVIAAVNGMAAGGGFELTLAADMVVAADHAEFFLPEVKIGIVPDSGGILRLPKRLPRAIAMEMLFTGRRMAAMEAARYGLVNRVVPAAELLASARELASQIVSGAPLATAAIKAVVAATDTMTVEDGYRLLRGGKIPEYERVTRSEDAKEGPRAFAEKRQPVWRGR
ncbi:MAG: enoyl-CoA hydratase-related protein [Dongiaceae bacterium]